MRVLLITWACDKNDISEPGISYRWVSEIAKDHDVTLFSVSVPRRFGCVKEQFPDLNVIEWKDINLPRRLERMQAIVKPGYLPYYFRARRFLKKLIKHQKFDVIHHLSPFAWRYPSPAAGLGLPLVKGPVAGGLQTPKQLESTLKETSGFFNVLRSSDAFRKKYDPWLIKSYSDINLLLVASPYVVNIIKPLRTKEFIVENEHGVVEPIPYNDRSKNVKTGINVLYVGRVIRTKGVRDAIRAFSKMSFKDATLTIVGDGDDMDECQKEVKLLGLDNRIIFLGWCDQPDIQMNYRSADIFLFPSFREPSGGVLLEAMLNSLPCITCDYGGPGFIVNNTCGILVKPQSELEFAEEISKALDLLAGDIQLRIKLSKGAWNRAINDFNWTKKRKRIAKIYSDLV